MTPKKRTRGERESPVVLKPWKKHRRRVKEVDAACGADKGALKQHKVAQATAIETPLQTNVTVGWEKSNAGSLSVTANTDAGALLDLDGFDDALAKMFIDVSHSSIIGSSDLLGFISNPSVPQVAPMGRASLDDDAVDERDTSHDFVLQLDSGESVLLQCDAEGYMAYLHKVCSTSYGQQLSEDQISEAMTFWEDLALRFC